MKKVIIAALAVMSLSVLASAEIFVGVKGGVGASDDNVKEAFDGNYDYSDDKSILGAELGFDMGDKNRLGVKAGFNTYGKIDSSGTGIDVDREVLLKNTVSVPATIYYKYAPNKTGLHFWLGGGATWASLKFQSDKDDVSKNKSHVFPHVAAGIEWRIIELVAIGLDLNYNFNAKISYDGLYRDFTGVEGFLGARLYFF